MSATIGRSAATGRRPRSSTTRAIGAASIPQAHLAGYAGILQADAYDGYNKLYLADRKPGPIREAACWAHARRKFFVLADIEENARRKAVGKSEIPLSPIAIEVVRRIDALFAIERVDQRQEPRRAAGGPPRRKPASGRRSHDRPCASRRRGCRAGTTSPRRSSTCSTAGRPSRCSSTTGACACPRMMLRRGNPQPGAAALAGALGGFSFHATTIRS